MPRRKVNSPATVCDCQPVRSDVSNVLSCRVEQWECERLSASAHTSLEELQYQLRRYRKMCRKVSRPS